MSTGRQILRNVGALTLARGVTASVTLVTTIYLGRVLGPDAFGILSWGLALLTYFLIFPNLGLNVVGVREAARDAGRVPRLVGEILGLRVLVSVVVFAGYLALVFLLDKPLLFKLVVAIQGLALFGHAASVEWVYEGIQQMGVLARRHVAVSLLTLLGTVLLVHSPDDLLVAAAASVAALVLGNGWLLVTYRRHFGSLRLRLDPGSWAALLRPGIPIAVSLFMVQIYTSMDQLILGLIKSEEAVGWYAAGARLLTAALIPSQILLQAFMPALSGTLGDPAAMRAEGRRFLSSLLVIGFPIAAAGALLAPQLILVFGPEYAPGAPALAILMGNALLGYFHVGLGRTLVAWDREREYMLALLGGGALNVVLNLALIPPFGLVGAAAATVASEAAVLAVTARFHYRIVHQLYGDVLLRALLATAAGVGGGALLAGLLGWPLLPRMMLMAAGYAVAALAFRLLDVNALRHLLRSSAT